MAILIDESRVRFTETSDEVLFGVYCEGLDRLARGHVLRRSYIESVLVNEGILDTLKGLNIPGAMAKFFAGIKEMLGQIKDQFKGGWTEIVNALKQRDVFALFKAIGFNIAKLLGAVNAASALVRQGLFKIFEEIAKTDTWKQVQSGALKVDELLNRYPLLKKIGGPVIAGLLFWIWLNMTFIGNLDYDFNFSDLIAALKGSYSLHDLFTSPAGIQMLTLLGTGMFAGISFPWLGKSLYNLIVGIIYTGLMKLKQSNSSFAKAIRKVIPVARVEARIRKSHPEIVKNIRRKGPVLI